VKIRALEWEKKRLTMENRFPEKTARPKKTILIVKEGEVVLDRLEEVFSGCCRTVTDDEAIFEWEVEEKKFWERWQQHLRQEKRNRISGVISDSQKVASL
jgi:hypothetical protein